MQWYVFRSTRKHVWLRTRPLTRPTAYSVLAVLAAINFAGVRLTFGSSGLHDAGHHQQVAAVAYFSYLGLALFLCLAFLVLDAADILTRGLGYLWRTVRSRAGNGWSRPGEQRTVPETSSHIVHDFNSQPKEAFVSRRSFLKWGGVVSLVGGASLASAGIGEAFRRPTVEEFHFSHPSLNSLPEPLVIIQVTDFHFGLFFQAPELERLVEILNGIEAHAVIITGDLFHSTISPVEDAPGILRGLRPRTWDNLVILGNHDFYTGERRAVRGIERSGLRLLRDEWMTVREGAATIHVGGIDDPMNNWLVGKAFPAFERFADTMPGDSGLRILLSHRPGVLPLAAEKGMDLVLSGHTHGGQVIMPTLMKRRGVSLARVAYPYTHGWYRSGQTRMYLNRGVGLTFVPWRLNCPPEIAVLRLGPESAPA